jgi:hypothetical protein
MFGPEQLFPEAMGVSLPVAVALWLLLALLAELARVVGIRVFASPESGVPDGLFDSIGSTTLNSLVASFIVTILVLLGAALLLIPGILVAILMEFVRQEVALGDANAFEALSESYGHVKSNFLAVFALGTVLFLLIIVTSQVAGMAASGPLPVVPSFVPAVATTAVTVYALAVMTDAYQQAVGGGAGGSSASGSDAPSSADGSPL